jgi:hypothetical protein
MLWVALASVAGSQAGAWAQSTAGADREIRGQMERSNSINLSPFSLLLAGVALNYERMFAGGHGLIVGGQYSGRGFFAPNDTKEYDLEVGYRWHWRGRQSSGFLGVMAGYSHEQGEFYNVIRATRNELSVQALRLTANIGKRWAWDNGLNFTFRVGAGYRLASATAKEDTPQARSDAQDQEHPLGFDGELSIGYTF